MKLHPGATPGALVRPALYTMPMGDLNAVDFAREAHGRLLAQAGSWLPQHRLLAAEPVPPGPWIEMLTVDDHVGIAFVPAGSPNGSSALGGGLGQA
eukprot:15469521-Alexandrium_andersonii.AAC.1